MKVFQFLLVGWEDGGGEELGLGGGDGSMARHPLPCLGHHLR